MKGKHLFSNGQKRYKRGAEGFSTVLKCLKAANKDFTERLCFEENTKEFSL